MSLGKISSPIGLRFRLKKQENIVTDILKAGGTRVINVFLCTKIEEVSLKVKVGIKSSSGGRSATLNTDFDLRIGNILY